MLLDLAKPPTGSIGKFDRFEPCQTRLGIRLRERGCYGHESCFRPPDSGVTTDSTRPEIIAHCTGKITSNAISSLKATVKPLFSESKPVVLDLTNVSYLDSSGLGAIVGLYVSAKTAKSQLKLSGLNKHLKELFILRGWASLWLRGVTQKDLT